MPELQAPTPFGNYLLLDLINAGGMAEVFRAVAFGIEGFQRMVAIKRILPHWAADPAFVNMLIDEARIAVQLNDPNIVQILELGMVESRSYIAMEYIAGRDLRHIIEDLEAQGRVVPTPHAAFIVSAVCSALDHAHRKTGPDGAPLNIVHRDVSPHNVLVGFDGSVKVTDFGIAKAEHRASNTEAGALKGKFAYMSPEQVRGFELDRRADIFSVGILLFELGTGKRLFSDASDFRILERVRSADVPPPRSVNPALPEAFERVIMKALAADREERYQWASELYDDLQPFLIDERSIFTTQKLRAFVEAVYAREITVEQKRTEELLGLAAQHGPIKENAEPTASAERATLLSGGWARPKTVVLAVGSGKVPQVPTAAPPTPAPASSAGGWDDTQLSTGHGRAHPRAEPSEANTKTGAAEAGTAQPGATEPITEPRPALPETTAPGPTRTSPVAAIGVAVLIAIGILGLVIYRSLKSLPAVGLPAGIATVAPPSTANPPPLVSTTTVVGAVAKPVVDGTATKPDDREPRPDATPETPAPADRTPEQTRQELAKVKKALDAQIKRAGILTGDLPTFDAQRAKLTSASKHNKPLEALEAAERALQIARAAEIDEAFVNAKLARFNKLSDANKEDKLRPELERLAADIATAVDAGDYKAANFHLNKAFRLLKAAN